MRLSQLARQVSRTSKELIVFLHSRGIENYSGTNAKIDPDHVRLVLDHFIPERITSSKETISAGKNDPASDPLQTADRPAKQELHSENSMDPVKNLSQSKEPEIIRAPKMKLQGVKVIGKIELPEKPSKKAEKKPDKRENMKSSIGELEDNFADKKVELAHIENDLKNRTDKIERDKSTVLEKIREMIDEEINITLDYEGNF